MLLTFSDVTFSYDSSPIGIFENLSLSVPEGWTGVVGANGQGKSTFLKLATGHLSPGSGGILMPGDALYCAQPTSSAPLFLEGFAYDWSAEASRLRSVLKIDDDWPWRFDTLSHGERKRLQLAIALSRQPYVLAIDEPTNHLDAQARDWVAEALASYRGVGLLVSHDRDLLDSLVSRCVFLDAAGVTVRPGTYTHAQQQVQAEREAAASQRAAAKAEIQRLKQEASRRRTEADRAHAMRSKRHLDPKDVSGRAKIDLAIFTGKDGQAGRLSAQLAGRMKRAQAQLDSLTVEKTYADDVWLPNSASRRNVLAELEAGTIPLGPDRRLSIPHLIVGPIDRIGIVGPNGAGKSTLIGRIVEAVTLAPERVLYVPQELSAEQTRDVLGELNGLGEAALGEVLTILARLGSVPERVLRGESPSPGELRKLMVGLGIRRAPHLLVLDEPTNHLDLPATEAMERALGSYPGALLIVSHDRTFVRTLCDDIWRIEADPSGSSTLTRSTAVPD